MSHNTSVPLHPSLPNAPLAAALDLALPSHRTSIALNFRRTEALLHPFLVLLRRALSVGLAHVAPFRTLTCVSLFDLATSAYSSPCVPVFLSLILPQPCRNSYLKGGGVVEQQKKRPTRIKKEFVNLSNHLISTSQQERKLAIRNENALRKSRDRVVVLLKYVDNIHEDDTMATDHGEPLDSEEDGSDA
ncbi:hypothetical protein AHAS_Ahas19G0119700 [Arachis hypogaea]